MIPTLGLVLLAGVLVGAGVYLVTDRTFTRIVIGLAHCRSAATSHDLDFDRYHHGHHRVHAGVGIPRMDSYRR